MKHIEPGSWIQAEDGSLKPNLNDPAMAERYSHSAIQNLKSEINSDAGGNENGTLNQ